MIDDTRPDDYRELLIGCGYTRDKRLALPGMPVSWKNLTTLDNNGECKPDYIWNLESTPWVYRHETKIPDNFFNEIHAYEVLEHLGQQGDAESFFAHFSEIYRILKPGGHLFATCPSRTSPWLWGDPSHRRAITQESLCFLDQKMIAQNRKAGTNMSDFSRLWHGDFRVVGSSDDTVLHTFCLQACKPVRCFDKQEQDS